MELWHKNARRLPSTFLLSPLPVDELAPHPLRGQIFECFVIGLLFKERLHLGLDPAFYFWRNSHGIRAYSWRLL